MLKPASINSFQPAFSAFFMAYTQNSALCWRTFEENVELRGRMHHKFALSWCCMCFIDSTLSVLVRSAVCSTRLAVYLLCLSVSYPTPPPSTQVKLAEAVLWTKGSAVAGLSAVGGLQLFPSGLCHSGGGAAAPGAAHRHQAVTVWVKAKKQSGWDF